MHPTPVPPSAHSDSEHISHKSITYRRKWRLRVSEHDGGDNLPSLIGTHSVSTWHHVFLLHFLYPLPSLRWRRLIAICNSDSASSNHHEAGVQQKRALDDGE
jgi:hypothetical protein